MMKVTAYKGYLITKMISAGYVIKKDNFNIGCAASIGEAKRIIDQLVN